MRIWLSPKSSATEKTEPAGAMKGPVVPFARTKLAKLTIETVIILMPRRTRSVDVFTAIPVLSGFGRKCNIYCVL